MICSKLRKLFYDLFNKQPPKLDISQKEPSKTPPKQEKPPVPASVENLANLYATMQVKKELTVGIQRVLNRINQNAPRYKQAATLCASMGLTTPWEVIAVIHLLESSGNMARQILNGQPYNQKTTIVPKGLGPWNSWEESATTGIKHQGNRPPYWSIGYTLDYLERWNGLGYRKYHKDINTPYLWSGSNHYTKGKYSHDGKYDPNLVSKQLGAALLLQAMGYKGDA